MCLGGPGQVGSTRSPAVGDRAGDTLTPHHLLNGFSGRSLSILRARALLRERVLNLVLVIHVTVPTIPVTLRTCLFGWDPFRVFLSVSRSIRAWLIIQDNGAGEIRDRHAIQA